MQNSIELLVASVTSLLGLFGVIITCIFSYMTHKKQNNYGVEISEINDAVNHRHEKRGNNAPKLYDLIWENHVRTDELIQWKRSYDDGPLYSGGKLVEFFNETNSQLKEIEENIKIINGKPPCLYHRANFDDKE